MKGAKLTPFIRYAEQTNSLPNRHPTYAYDCRMLYCLSGRGTMDFSGRIFPLLPGTLCLFPSATKYLPRSEPEAPMQFIIVNFDYYSRGTQSEEPFEPVLEKNFHPEKAIDSWKETGEPCFMQPQVFPDFQSVENELLSLVQEWKIRKLHFQEIASSLLALILYRTLQRSSSGPQVGRRMDELLNFIHTHYAQRLDYASISERLHYHPYYLNALMRAQTGQSLHQYIMHYRIHEACRLLTETSDSVGEVARRVGFENANHFSAFFKKIIGVSPLQYRRSHNL